MSDVKNLYILKPDVIIDEYKDIRIVRPSPGSSFIQEIPNAVFDKLFELLDVESLTTQLDNILQDYGARQYQRGFKGALENPLSNEPIPRDKELDAETLAEVLELIGITKDEQ